MKEVKGNIWDYYDKGQWIVITTNGTIKKNGACVMGRGVAKTARDRFPNLDKVLGRAIDRFGNQVFVLNSISDARLISFPVKHNWQEKADLKLIERSCRQLEFVAQKNNQKIYLVRPGCGNGQLKWDDVKPILDKYLDHRFIVVNNE